MHRPGRAHVFDDFSERPLLRRRGTKRKDFLQALPDARIGAKGDSGQFASPLPLERQTCFEQKELFKDEPHLRGTAKGVEVRQPGAGGRKMSVAEGLPSGKQAERPGHGGRQGVVYAGQRFESGINRPAKKPRGQAALAGCFINRDDPPDFQRVTRRARAARVQRGGTFSQVRENLILRLRHLQAALVGIEFDLAVEREVLTGFDDAFEVRGVEPFAAQVGSALADIGAKNPHGAPANREHSGRADARNHRGHFTGPHFGKPAQASPVLVAEGEVVEQVLDGEDSFVAQDFRPRFAHAFDELHGSGKSNHARGR
ncbi:MAG: hypothetical protein HW398_610 [Acidobacteria bacterium]|nr:hypothetical protein [Acidobacteriota bacterium]